MGYVTEEVIAGALATQLQVPSIDLKHHHIKPEVTLTAPSVTKTYDGGTTYTTTAGDLTSIGAPLVGGDTISAATIAYTNRDFGIGNKTVILSGSTINDGNGGANYTIMAQNGNSTITINPVALTVTANNQSKTFGNTFIFTGNEFTSAGLQNGETIGSATLASAGSPASAPVVGSPYAITASAATGGTFTPSNYAITYVNGSMTVNLPPAVTLPPSVLATNNLIVFDLDAVAYGTSGSSTIADGVTDFLNTLPPTAAGPDDGNELVAVGDAAAATLFVKEPTQRNQAGRGCFNSRPLAFMSCR